ncbi:response regulator [Paenibacillus sp. JX-17]|uniref:Response regulator n=1 Tax=Paenibacillus lacisoli TaxID=3064525 RepID=A0ABT9C8U0_9BACL|nr:response regulator [Paenibacillus sp. JX-17]MDO7905676.1 response regulator [Paenibacillus sp. JX-17]
MENLDEYSILCVEDNELNMTLIRYVVRKMPGFKLLEARTAEKAIPLAMQHQPDLILMDISLPVMDGYEALALLRANPLTQYIPAVAISSFASQSDIRKGLQAGFEAYFTKPVDVKVLTRYLYNILGRNA